MTTSSAGGAPVMGTGGVAMTGAGGARVTGTGGAAMTGVGGAGDDKAAGKNACTQYAADYDTALAKATECDAKGDACGKLVPAALSGCQASCMTYVQDDSALKELRRQWDKAGCESQACAAIVCLNLGTGTCAVSDDEGDRKDDRASKKGTCSNNLIVL